MLGPFRVRNLRHPQLRRPPSPTQNTVPLSRPRDSLSEDAVILVDGDRYNHTIKEFPTAKLKYVDDDRDVVTVGSKDELAQRLDEPVPAMVRSRPRIHQDWYPLQSNSGMHVFEIDRTETTVQIWEKIEEQTKVLMDSQRVESEELAQVSQSAELPEVIPEMMPKNVTAMNDHATDLRAQHLKTAMNNIAKNLRAQHFKSTNPPVLGEETNKTSDSKVDGERRPLQRPTFASTHSVLTDAGRRQAQEIGQRLQEHSKLINGLYTQLKPVDQQGLAGNRWSSYSTGENSAFNSVRSTEPFAGHNSTQPGPSAPTEVSSSDPLSEPQRKGSLEKSFFDNFQAQLDKLSAPALPSVLNNKESLSATNNEHVSADSGSRVVESLTPKLSTLLEPISTKSVNHIPRTEYSPAAVPSDQEETKPLLPSKTAVDSNDDDVSYTFFREKPITGQYGKHDEAELTAELIRRGIVPHTKKFETLVNWLEHDDADCPLHRTGKGATEESEAEPSRPLQDPVEVSAGKMIMQMVSSVMSNLNTLNSQIQEQARPQIPQEALRLRGYPDSAHADAMWRDIETLKDTFEEFDIATSDIRRSFERLHDHDEFPLGSGMFRLHGLSSTRGPLSQIATALQDLVTGLQKISIPAVGGNGRLQYHIPRRLATSGYEDTWEMRIQGIPAWALQSHVTEFVEKTVVEYGIDATVAQVKVIPDRTATLEIQDRRVAENVLRILSASLWDGKPIDVSMQRKLFPDVYGVSGTKTSSKRESLPSKIPKVNISASGTLHTHAHAAGPRGQKPGDALEKRKAIQDRRAAWRREYKARTQTVRFQEPDKFNDTAAVHGSVESDDEPSVNDQPAIVYRHVPNSASAARIITNSGHHEPERPLTRPYSYVTPSSVRLDSIKKRLSIPTISTNTDNRSRSRSPDSIRKDYPPLRRHTSLQLNKNVKDADADYLFGAAKHSQAKIPRSKLTVEPAAEKEDNFIAARKVSDEFKNIQAQFPNATGKTTSVYIPYSDRDPAPGYIPYRPEPDLRRAKSLSALKAPTTSAAASVSQLPSNESSCNGVVDRTSFPALPTMEPLIPVRLNSTATRSESEMTRQEQEKQHARSDKPSDATRKLFVSNLSPNLGEAWIHDRFSIFGPLVRVSLSREHSGPSKGTCYIQYYNTMDAIKACHAMSGMEIYGRKLFCSFSPPTLQDSLSRSAGRPETSGEFSLRMMGREFSGEHVARDLQRSATVTGREQKSAAGPGNRRPYSVNFDGRGRMEWENFMTKTTAPPSYTSTAPPAPQTGIHLKSELPGSTLYDNFKVPGAWPPRNGLRNGEPPRLPFLSNEPEVAKDIAACVEQLKALGYGAGSRDNLERLKPIAQAVMGNLEDAIDMFEEERRAWTDRQKNT